MKDILRGTTFLAIVACLLWSTAFAGIKIGLQYTSPIQFAGLRFFLAGTLLIPLCMMQGKYFSALKTQWKLVLIVSLTQTFVQYTLFYWGISLLPGGVTAITVGSQPLLVALMAHFAMKNESLTWRKMTAIAMGLSGIVLITVGRGLDASGGIRQIFGILLLILSNISSGMGNIIVSRQPKVSSAVMLSSQQLMFGGIGLFVLSLFIEPFGGFVFPAPYYLALGWLSMLSATAFTIWFILLQRPGVKVSDLNVWKFIIPVSGALLSWLIIPGEKPDVFAVVGMIIIAGALVMYYKQKA